MINRSFQLLKTNPKLTTNLKLVVSSDYKLYLETFDTNKQLSDEKYKHFQISKNSLYEDQLVRFYKGLPSDLAFDVKYDNDNKIVQSSYDKQFDDMYWSGAKSVEDKWFNEDYEYFAPLFIRKETLPEGFIVLRVDEPTPYEMINNEFVISELNKDNFNDQIVDKWKCVNFFDMRYQSDLGYFLSKNFTNNTRFPIHSFELDFKKFNFSRWSGIDYTSGSYVVKEKYLQDALFYEQPHFRLEKMIVDGYKENNMIYPNILNMKFLFNDVPSTPELVRNYSMNRYYGFYIDKLEFVTNLTSYMTPSLKPDIGLINNIFCSGTTEMIESPFVDGFKDNITYWIQYEGKFYEVVKVQQDDKYLYKIISDRDMKDIDFSKIYDNSCIINYEHGFNYRCRAINNPSGYTNFVSGMTSKFQIDPYDVIDDYYSSNPNDAVTHSMYADLYLINIDGIYHILKKRGTDYFIQSDYGINSFPTYLEYWKGGKDSGTRIVKNVSTYKQTPITYPVYRLKLTDVKDFDMDIVNTHFADFDYEKDTYHLTNEHKIYATDYMNESIGREFMIHARGEDGQYQIMNAASEYIGDDELFEVLNNNSELSDIWRKNQSYVKWGAVGSLCQCDYPYKMNNSIKVGDIFNRTANTILNLPDEAEKNLDYFYRIGNFFSGNTTIGSTGVTVRYFNQSTNIETDLMNKLSSKFNLGLYLNSNVDYFEYFFKNKMYYRLDYVDYLKPTSKYSVFNCGDQYSQSTTIFKGLNFNAGYLSDIVRNDTGAITDYIYDNSKTFNGYKFAIILNDVYLIDGGGIVENGLSGNTVIDNTVDAIHVFLNEKFKNLLIIVNATIPIKSGFVNLNNVPIFNEKTGLYTAKTVYGESLSATSPQFDPSKFTAANFTTAFGDLNNITEFDSGITFYYIDADGNSGSTGNINVYNPNNSMSTLSGWTKNIPPYMLSIVDPISLETKRSSYITVPIKGPVTNIYDKYKTYYDDQTKKKSNVTEPLARAIYPNQKVSNINTIYASNKITSNNVVFRYNGSYEPIFKDIPLFGCSYIFNSVNSGKTQTTINGWGSNYKFDTSLQGFGVIEEMIFSKVNPKIVPLKLKNTDQDMSIYPRVDEYGYQYSSRFIFNSSWDREFYVLTNPDQIVNTKSFATNFVVVTQPSIPFGNASA